MAQRVNEVMTPVPVAVSPDTTLVTVSDLMRRHGIGDVLVVHEGRLRGLVTDRDIVVRAVAVQKDVGATAVGRRQPRDANHPMRVPVRNGQAVAAMPASVSPSA